MAIEYFFTHLEEIDASLSVAQITYDGYVSSELGSMYGIRGLHIDSQDFEEEILTSPQDTLSNFDQARQRVQVDFRQRKKVTRPNILTSGSKFGMKVYHKLKFGDAYMVPICLYCIRSGDLKVIEIFFDHNQTISRTYFHWVTID
ncbi:MAG: hypothetical protein AAFW00_14475 [Bacteroidota bacterium]